MENSFICIIFAIALIHVMPSNIMPCITKNEENLFKWKSKKK